MTTTEKFEGAQLTRRQMRELQLTGQDPEATAEPAVSPAPQAPLARASETVVPPAPSLDDIPQSADGEAHPRTRREARELDRVRTASVPIVSVELAAAAARAREVPPAPEVTEADVQHASDKVDVPVEVEAPAEVQAEAPADVPAEPEAELVPDEVSAAVVADEDIFVEAEIVEDVSPAEVSDADVNNGDIATEAPAEPVDEPAAPRVAAGFGATVEDVPATNGTSEESFDSLLSRGIDTSGTSTASHALIMPSSGFPPLTAPVTSNGQTLLTGTFSLPESLASQGVVGNADGKDVDAVLIDGELAPASSPTPIAATAAVSQAKTPGEIIKPPAPEKSNKLMLVLAITAGALAVTLGVVIVVAIMNGALAA